ncbi:MAG: amino acid adenylation domain-containing protein [Methylotenera sp.]|nr:amino acid adenylation domain-containing protein [Oligoflexia bacterium]
MSLGESLLSLDRLFELQVAATPDALALELGDVTLSYRQLDRRVNQLAHFLSHLGVNADVPVGICLERSVETIVAVLAVAKAGGAYVPLDPTYPQSRLAVMFKDSRASVLLTQKSLRNTFSSQFSHALAGADVVCLDEIVPTLENECEEKLTQVAALDHLGYVIYTSGSTGVPKGVALTQRALSNLIEWQKCASGAGIGSRTLQFTPISFDVSFQEIYSTLATGGTLVLIPEELRLDPEKLLRFLSDRKIDRLYLPFVALQSLADTFAIFVKSGQVSELNFCLSEVITAGEQLQVNPSLIAFFNFLGAAEGHCRLSNHYGPSETHVVTALDLTGAPEAWPALPSIGRAIPGARTHLMDENLKPVSAGTEGELYLSGVCLARGYLNRPDLTAERFIENSTIEGLRVYKTGDLARELPDGTLEFLGRADQQIKLRGYRIELGEIEIALASLSGVRQAVVSTLSDGGDRRLVAYVIAADDLAELPEAELFKKLRAELKKTLPDHMVPSQWMKLENLPKTPSGKVDRRALPILVTAAARIEKIPAATAPQFSRTHDPRSIQALMIALWKDLLRINDLGVDESFFDLGGNSLLCGQMVARLRQQHQLDISILKVFEFPTIAQLSRILSASPIPNLGPEIRDGVVSVSNLKVQAEADGIAIIGMAGRFPGAETVEALWANLVAARDTVTFFKDEELHGSIPESLKRDPQYVKARGVLQGVEYFDAAFFGISPREAEILDPQQRIFLETAWQALEDAGHSAEKLNAARQSVGVFAGVHNNSYYPNNLSSQSELIDRVGAFQVMVGNEKDYVATRTAHKMDLRGPAISIHTGCSTSLVAIVQAFQALRSGMCDLAIAGGAAVTVPIQSGHLHQEGGMLSADGHCRPFDEKATGTLFSDGAGAVVLRRLSDALAEGDQIYAVIRGVALNNDGSEKMSFTAPSISGQSEVITRAQGMAKVDPSRISYIEAHGTATPIGDPMEIEALTRAFRRKTSGRQFCAVGSIKSNFGHLTAAAGVAGVIKTALSLKNRILPASLHFTKANSKIDFVSSPFFVNHSTRAWSQESGTRVAGVSSFGVGGTNAHIVLEEAPARKPSSSSKPQQLLILSAQTPQALERMSGNLISALGGLGTALDPASGTSAWADAAFTLQTGRKSFKERRFVVASSAAEASQALQTLDVKSVFTRSFHRNLMSSGVAFMFPGQGTQYVGMGKNLYDLEPAYRAAFDQCCEILKPVLGRDLKDWVFLDTKDPALANEAAAALRSTEITQPALFALEYSLAQLWLSWGIKPTALIGHSVGEFTAACIAGVFSLEDALGLVALRGQMMKVLPPGGMLSVRLGSAKVLPILVELGDVGSSLSIASINSATLCIVAGPSDSLEKFEAKVTARGVICKSLHTSHAFHSSMMDSIVEPFETRVRAVKLSPPRIPIVSTVTGKWLEEAEALSPTYWANHLRATVNFSEAVQTLWEDPTRVLLEVGPRNTLSVLARQHAKDLKKQVAISSLSSSPENFEEWSSLLKAVGQLWQSGFELNWEKFHRNEDRRRVSLPTYPFERKKFWIEPAQGKSPGQAPSDNEKQTLTGSAQSPIRSKPEVNMSASFETHAPLARKQGLIPQLRAVLEESSGMDLGSMDDRTTFTEMGMDSLFLTQAALELGKKFKVKVTFRQLLEDFSNLDALSGYIDSQLPAEAAVSVPVPSAPVFQTVPSLQPYSASGPQAPMSAAMSAEQSQSLQGVISQQLQLMAKQLEVLSGAGVQSVSTPSASIALTPAAATPPVTAVAAPSAPSALTSAPAVPFGAAARISLAKDHLSEHQKAHLDAFSAKYTAKTGKSKAMTQANRAHLADPRVVSGFRPLTKEIVYPVVVDGSSGSRLWDIDGNEYIDLTCGFGSNLFGNSASFIAEAVQAQLKKGYEIGPQHPLTGTCARLFCELTGLDRAVFCNTGSEAVLGAMRLARTVTGRDLIVTFNGSYHGIVDEVIVRSGRNLKSLPAAPGIPTSAVENILVLDYGTDEALRVIRERASEIAAVMVEPVQSRRPDFQPREFLHAVRKITQESGSALIFDEVITGFRVHPGGAQAHFGIRADLATYGKIVGGGMPIGVIAGINSFMDALDGGAWAYGDSSFPETGVTYFAGTFVRHPLALAAAKVVLDRLKEAGPALQAGLNARADAFARELNDLFKKSGAPLKLKNFGSMMKLVYTEDQPQGDLLYPWLRFKGLHIWDARPIFMTTAHTDADMKAVIKAFREAIEEMQTGGFLPAAVHAAIPGLVTEPPTAGAKLGKDASGTPAWFIPDPQRPGKYMQVQAREQVLN